MSKIEWVKCPICGEGAMKAERPHDPHVDGWYVSCVNLGCPSNQVGESYHVSKTPNEPDKSIQPPDIDYDENWSTKGSSDIYMKIFIWVFSVYAILDLILR